MISYLRCRWPERSTRFVGLPLILLALLLAIAAWHWRVDLRWAYGALTTGIISGAFPDRIFNALRAWRALREAFPRIIPATKPTVGSVAIVTKGKPVMFDFSKVRADIAAAEALAVKEAEAVIAAAKTQAGQKVVADAISLLPADFQPVATAAQRLITDPSASNVMAVLSDIYEQFEAAKSSAAAVGVSAAQAPVQPAV
jgi:hypothetical protein